MSGGTGSAAARMWVGVQDGWDYIRFVTHVLWPARFPILVFLLGSVALFVDQGQQILISLGSILDGGAGSRILFFAAVTVWALNCWYGARVMLHIRFHKSADQEDARRKWLMRHAPRYLGLFCYLIVAAAQGVAQGCFTYFVVVCVGLGVLFLVFVWKRRVLLGRWMKSPSGEIRRADEVYDGFGDLPRATWLAVGGTFALGAATFGASIGAPAWPMVIDFDPAVILLLGIATWVPAGSFLVYLARKNRLPILSFVFLLAVIFSFWNDNHAVRICGDAGENCGAGPSPDSRPTLGEAFEAWNAHAGARANGPETARPLIVIASAGGGSRAAYWTATVLGEIHQRVSNFADHVFAISGVSGGSLGAVVYRALLAEGTSDAELGSSAQNILSKDFLSPALAAMLYPDLFQRFWPFAWFPDRAEALEIGWERAWSEEMRNDNLARPYLSMWGESGADGGKWTGPALLLNGTHMESGKRVITSNIRIGAEAFPDAIDLYDVIATDVPRSTAANLSARFPYVQPGATLYFDCARLHSRGGTAGEGRPSLGQDQEGLQGRCESDDSVMWGRVVDGGYFENYGAVTATQVVDGLRPGIVKDGNIRLIVIQISSDPDIGSFVGSESPAQLAEPLGFAPELRTPPRGLLSTRTARGTLATRMLKHQVESIAGLEESEDRKARFFHFRMCNDEKHEEPPLGWVLSSGAMKVIAKDYIAGCNGNERQLGELSDILK
jgi:hypothetical protein